MLANYIEKSIRPYLISLSDEQNLELVIAYSGGLDSTCLLACCAQLIAEQPDMKVKLTAIHVNHGLSSQAENWEAHCQAYCDQLGIPLLIGRSQLVKQPGQSLEAQAREIRYQWLSQLSPQQPEQQTLILTGQHLNDQVENFFLRLKRGSGPKGLASMKHSRFLSKQLVLIRPFLNVSQALLCSYAKDNQLNWVEDESNQNSVFDRNYLRNDVLPLMQQRWPGFDNCVARAADLCSEYNELVEDIARSDLNQCLLELQGRELAISKLNLQYLHHLSYVRQKHCLRAWFENNHLDMPSIKQLDNLLQEVIDASTPSTAHLKIADYVIKRYRDTLYLLKPHHVAVVNIKPLAWQGEKVLNVIELQQGLTFTLVGNEVDEAIVAPHKQQKVSIRFNIKGSTVCTPYNRCGSRSVKKLLHEFKVPSWQRDKVPFLFYDDQLVAAIGLWRCQTKFEPNQGYLKVAFT